MQPENNEAELTRLKRKAQIRDRPKRQVGLVRWLWPEIRATLNAGYSVREIQTGLADVGVHFRYRSLALYIRQFRLQEKNTPTAGAAPINIRAIPGEAFRPDEGELGPPGVKQPHDPLRNIREMRAKRPTFEYKPPTPEDKDKLI